MLDHELASILRRHKVEIAPHDDHVRLGNVDIVGHELAELLLPVHGVVGERGSGRGCSVGVEYLQLQPRIIEGGLDDAAARDPLAVKLNLQEVRTLDQNSLGCKTNIIENYSFSVKYHNCQ